MALAVLNLASQARFSPGQVVMTAGVDELVRQGRLNPTPYLRRHLHGDWGDLCDDDWQLNDAALKSGDRVLGEREQRTCENCTKTQTTPGVGLTPMIQEEYETKLQALQELVTGARPTTLANLDAAGSSSLPITRGVIEALRDEPDQDMLGRRLASEAALSSVLEKALLLQRTLLTGKKEPNVAANELAVRAVDQENSALEQEINNLKTELELRRTLAGNSAMAIIQRHSTRAAGSRGIFEGDTTRDRLREVQKPRSGTP